MLRGGIKKEGGKVGVNSRREGQVSHLSSGTKTPALFKSQEHSVLCENMNSADGNLRPATTRCPWEVTPVSLKLLPHLLDGNSH